MPLPPLVAGELPLGVHPATLREVLDQFGVGSAQRVAVGVRPRTDLSDGDFLRSGGPVCCLRIVHHQQARPERCRCLHADGRRFRLALVDWRSCPTVRAWNGSIALWRERVLAAPCRGVRRRAGDGQNTGRSSAAADTEASSKSSRRHHDQDRSGTRSHLAAHPVVSGSTTQFAKSRRTRAITDSPHRDFSPRSIGCNWTYGNT